MQSAIENWNGLIEIEAISPSCSSQFYFGYQFKWIQIGLLFYLIMSNSLGRRKNISLATAHQAFWDHNGAHHFYDVCSS